MKTKWKLIILFLAGLLILGTTGCGNRQGGEPATETVTESLKLGVLSLEDILPMVVANEKGYFAEEGLEVELISFQSTVESQSAFQSGEIDGMMNDMVVAALLKESGTDLRVTSVTLEATGERRRFAIVASPDSGINRVEDLKGKELGISFNSIIEYTTDEMLLSAGVNPEEVAKTAIPKIPVRLEMLINNNIEAANLPDPLITLAEFNGCKTIIDDRGRSISQAVMVMTTDTLAAKRSALEKYYRAVGKAIRDINASPQDYKETMAAHISIPAPIMDQYQVPAFPEPKLPTEEEVAKVLNWLREKGQIGDTITYDNFVEQGLY